MDLQTMNMPPDQPAMQAMMDIVREAGDWFLQQHGRPIKVRSIIRMRDGKRVVDFAFRLETAGLLPTPMEQDTFAAFIAGYRNAINLCLAYAETPPSNSKEARTIN